MNDLVRQKINEAAEEFKRAVSEQQSKLKKTGAYKTTKREVRDSVSHERYNRNHPARVPTVRNSG